MNLPSLTQLSSSSLTCSIVELRGRQRIDDVQFLWLLAEIDRRKSYEELACDSLWEFCKRELHLTNGAAGRRIGAARLLARFPAAADFLADGRLGLTTFTMLKDVLTEDNHLELLLAASSKSEPEVDELVRAHRPLSFVRDTVIRTVSLPPPPIAPAPPSTTSSHLAAPSAPMSSPAVTVTQADLPPAHVRAVDAEYVSLTIRVTREFMADLEQVSAALSHIVPGRKPADVLRECILRTLDEHAKRRGGLPARRPITPAPGVTSTSSVADGSSVLTPAPGVTSTSSVADGSSMVTPAPGVTSTSSVADGSSVVTPAPGVDDELDPRAVPIAVARVVWARANGCCTFVGTNGRQCRSTHQLEIQHIVPVALGGKATLDNLTLHCRRHNILQAQRDLGDDLMRNFCR